MRPQNVTSLIKNRANTPIASFCRLLLTLYLNINLLYRICSNFIK